MSDTIFAAQIMGHVALAQLKMQGMIAHNASPDANRYTEFDFDEVAHELKIKLGEFMVV